MASRFNDEQKKIILHGENPLMVLASAGGGKSTVLTARTIKKIQEGERNICVITFTRNTANDLANKFKQARVGNQVTVGTFHSICGDILRQEGYNISKRVKEYELENIFKKVIVDSKKINVKDIMSFISYQKNNMVGVEDDFIYKDSDYMFNQLRDCYRQYEEYKAKIGAYDFDDYLLLGHKVLSENPGKYSFDWVFVDETQDSNKLQMDIVDLLCPSNRITVVGDYRQCLLPDTKIKTLDGEKEIQYITKDDKIIVGSGYGHMSACNPDDILVKDYNGNMVKIKTLSGKELICTTNHGLFVSRNKTEKNDVVLTMFGNNADGDIPNHTLSVDNKKSSDTITNINSSDYDLLYKIGDCSSYVLEQEELSINAYLTNDNAKMELIKAHEIAKGMYLPVVSNDELVSDEVVSVELIEYVGLVYDINVSFYRNYVANDICVHNCMYSFRGSKPELFMDFYKTHENTEIVNMNINYRSHREIVNRSNYFIKKYYSDYTHHEDAIPNSVEDGVVDLIINDDKECEAYEVVDKIETMIGLGYEYKDIAILYRNNIQSQYIENELKIREIEYDIENNGSFFNRKEVDMVMCMLRLIDNKNDDSAFETLFRYRCEPFTFLSNTVLNDIVRLSNEKRISHIVASSHINVQAWQKQKLVSFSNLVDKLIVQHNHGYNLLQLIDNIIEGLDLVKYININYTNEDERQERLETLENLKKFVRSNTLDSFLKFVYEKNSSSTKQKDGNKVQMMTIHKSKGLEFKVVILVGVEQGKFPSDKSTKLEEANVFYVGVTRAIERMYISQIGAYNEFVEQYYGKKRYSNAI